MAKPPSLVASALATWNGKALLKGKKDISSFDKSVKSLGRTFGTVFGAAALLNFGKKAVNAFAADQAAAKSLEIQLKNTGYAFAAPSVEGYIANLQKATGVLDDHLRPALQTLLTASGSLVQSQKALAIALDVSAGTGKSVEEVSNAIAKGYTGQTTALGRLGAGISKTTLATGDMNKILDEASSKFSGQAKARLETYAGKMDALQVASANVSETIGKGILDALSLLGKDNSIEGATTKMESFGTAIADAILGMGLLINKVKNLGETTKVNSVLSWLFTGTPVDLLIKAGKKERESQTATNVGGYSGIPSANELVLIKEYELIKKANAARAKELAALNAKTAVDKLKDKFDVERIGLTAALNSATDDETKLRLRSQLAILDNNEVLAKKYLAELNAAEAVNKLANDAAKAGNLLVDGAAAAFARLALYNPVSAMSPGQGGGISNAPSGGISTNVVNGNNSLFNQPADPQGSNYNITLELAPNAGEFGQLVYNSFLLNQKNGNVQNYAGGNF